MRVDGYTLLGRTGTQIWDSTTSTFVTQPGSSDTVVLYDSTLLDNTQKRQPSLLGAQHKMFVLNINSSADSAANGIELSESDDAGVTWETTYVRTYATAVDLRLKLFISLVGAPETRIRYINSAAVLTRFRWSLLVDPIERGF